VAYEVVGIVGDTKYRSIDEDGAAIAYFPVAQKGSFNSTLKFQIRSDGEPAILIGSVTNLIAEVHPRLSVRFTTLEDQVAASLTRPKLLAMLSGFFGAVALLLAMLGLYGTLAYQVTSRRNEIGVRLALGAARSHVLGMVLGEVGRLVVLGVAIGVALTVAGTRLLASFLFGVTVMDPMTVAVSAAILASVALAAGALPAWHAARLDPMETLREE
jgi:ABC-type antimicrobial peptide transport system permease subunit